MYILRRGIIFHSLCVDLENADHNEGNGGMFNNLGCNVLIIHEDIVEQDENLNAQDIRVKLTPGKHIILTLPPHGTGGGVTYTRWGKKSCRRGAKLVYEGYAGGGWFNQKGNGANYLCLPKDPQYLSTAAPIWRSYLYGAEYESSNQMFGKTTHDYNVLCAVCLVPRKSNKLMIPAKISCPKTWTREYYGYLMTEYCDHYANKQYECVDHNPDVIGSAKSTNGALFYFIEAVCGHGLPCGPYVAKRAITCAVCTK